MAAAMAGVISPIMESAITIPSGPTITSAVRHATSTAFSPVPPRFAPAFIIVLVAMLFVPAATISASGRRARIGFYELFANLAALTVDDGDGEGFHRGKVILSKRIGRVNLVRCWKRPCGPPKREQCDSPLVSIPHFQISLRQIKNAARKLAGARRLAANKTVI